MLSALDELLKHDAARGRGIAILSAGTDGEDGPTDAAGAWLDADDNRGIAAPRARLG